VTETGDVENSLVAEDGDGQVDGVAVEKADAVQDAEEVVGGAADVTLLLALVTAALAEHVDRNRDGVAVQSANAVGNADHVVGRAAVGAVRSTLLLAAVLERRGGCDGSKGSDGGNGELHFE